MASIDKVRVIVVGDSGVGKTSLVHLICHNNTIANPSWTIGCSVDVKLHEYQAGTPDEKQFFVELWDVGGSINHQNSRAIFYNPVHGIILTHDLSNRKSQHNLRKWLAEVLRRDGNNGNNGLTSVSVHQDYDPEQFVGTDIPILVLGTKHDLAEQVREKGRHRASSIADEYNADEINVNCNDAKYFAPGSSNAVKLAKFFDRVIQRKYYTREHRDQTSPSAPERRRTLLSYTSPKGYHVD